MHYNSWGATPFYDGFLLGHQILNIMAPGLQNHNRILWISEGIKFAHFPHSLACNMKFGRKPISN